MPCKLAESAQNDSGNALLQGLQNAEENQKPINIFLTRKQEVKLSEFLDII